MNMKDIIEKIYNIDVIEKIKSGLVDNESKDIFDARIQYMLNGDRDTFVESVEPYLSNIVSWELNAAKIGTELSSMEVDIMGFMIKK